MWGRGVNWAPLQGLFVRTLLCLCRQGCSCPLGIWKGPHRWGFYFLVSGKRGRRRLERPSFFCLTHSIWRDATCWGSMSWTSSPKQLHSQFPNRRTSKHFAVPRAIWTKWQISILAQRHVHTHLHPLICSEKIKNTLFIFLSPSPSENWYIWDLRNAQIKLLNIWWQVSQIGPDYLI